MTYSYYCLSADDPLALICFFPYLYTLKDIYAVMMNKVKTTHAIKAPKEDTKVISLTP